MKKKLHVNKYPQQQTEHKGQEEAKESSKLYGHTTTAF